MAQYELNLLDYWLIVRKHKYAVLLTAVLVVAFTFALTQFFKPDPIYETSARVKFDRTRTFASLLLQSVAPRSRHELGTQKEVIRSFPVIEQVAKELGMLPADASTEMRTSADYLNTIYSLKGRLTTTIEERTNIIKITASAEEAERAMRMANATAVAYRAENIQSQNRMVTESRRFVEEQLAALERTLSKAEDILLDYKEREDVFSPLPPQSFSIR